MSNETISAELAQRIVAQLEFQQKSLQEIVKLLQLLIKAIDP